MNTKEKLDLTKAKGHLSLVIKKKGKIIREEQHNMILDSAEDIIAGLLAGDSGSEIIGIIVGDSQTAIVKTQTTLAGATFPKNLVSKSVSGNIATFNFKLETSDWNGHNIWQFALATGSALFSAISRFGVKTHPIEKDVETEVEGTWTIQVEV